MSKVLCLYSSDDPFGDVIVATWAAHCALGDGVEFQPVKVGDAIEVWYGLTDDGYKGRDVLWLGKPPEIAILRAMAVEARSVLVIGGGEDLTEIKLSGSSWKSWLEVINVINPISAQEGEYQAGDNLAAISDPARSVAGLTWDYLCSAPLMTLERAHGPTETFGQTPRPRIIDLIEKFATGAHEFLSDPSGAEFHAFRAFHAALSSYDWSDLPAMHERLDEWSVLANQYGAPIGPETLRWPLLLDEGRADPATIAEMRKGRSAECHHTRKTLRGPCPVCGALFDESGKQIDTASGEPSAWALEREEWFPVLTTERGRVPGFIPWSLLAPHEEQAQKNHGQTLRRLAERGGLGWAEALAIIEDRPYAHVDARLACVLVQRRALDTVRSEALEEAAMAILGSSLGGSREADVAADICRNLAHKCRL